MQSYFGTTICVFSCLDTWNKHYEKKICERINTKNRIFPSSISFPPFEIKQRVTLRTHLLRDSLSIFPLRIQKRRGRRLGSVHYYCSFVVNHQPRSPSQQQPRTRSSKTRNYKKKNSLLNHVITISNTQIEGRREWRSTINELTTFKSRNCDSYCALKFFSDSSSAWTDSKVCWSVDTSDEAGSS